MMIRKLFFVSLFIMLVFGLSSATATAQGPTGTKPHAPRAALSTAFTYQGQLKSGGSAYTGTCDMQFTLYDAASSGTQIGTMQSVSGVSVTNGLFTAPIDFGAGAFDGNKRFLQIAVKCGSETNYTTLASLQELTATPYALYASNGPFWALTGNSGTNASTNFLGTTDNVTLTLRANNVVGWRLASDGANTPNVIGGYSANWVKSGAHGATIGGGGNSTNLNSVTGSYSTVGGGYNNTAAGGSATVAGGDNNSTGNDRATVGGGYNNHANGFMTTVGGGDSNTASAEYATVPGGVNNSATMPYTLAAGREAKANHDGTFVWADSTDANFASTAKDQFLVRANGGVGINTNSPAANTLTVGGSGLQVGTTGTTLSVVQSGSATLGSGLAGVNVYTVTFSSAFSSTPNVMATVRGQDFNDTFAVTTRYISTSQFRVNVYRVDNNGGIWGQSLRMDWIAWNQ